MYTQIDDLKHADLIKEYLELKQNISKPLISYLSPSFFRNEDLGLDYNFNHINNPYIINKKYLLPEEI